MSNEGYPHVIEYRYERVRGQREHRYTEHADDVGFCLEHKESRRERWLVRYTHMCADDYLARVGAPHGQWVVSVYRQGDQRRHLVTIRMIWPGKKSEVHPSEKGPPVRR